MAQSQTSNNLLRALPSIDTLLRTATAKSLQDKIGLAHLSALARKVTEELRQEIMNASSSLTDQSQSQESSRAALLQEAERRLTNAHNDEVNSGLRRVINATGVVLHTNLGRAP